MIFSSYPKKRLSASRFTDLYFTGERTPAMAALLKRPWTYAVQIDPELGLVSVIFTLHEASAGEYFSAIEARIWISGARRDEDALRVDWTVESRRDGSEGYDLQHRDRAASVDEAHAAVMALVKHLRTLPIPSADEQTRLRDRRHEAKRITKEAEALESGSRSLAWEFYVRDYGCEPGTPRSVAAV